MMDCNDLLEQVRQFRCDRLKKVNTTVTSQDGRRFVETFNNNSYALQRTGISNGYVIDTTADITVSLIMQGLILGSQDVAAELQILEEQNVTHVLNVGCRIPNYFESRFVYKNVEILDDPSTDIRTFFEGCFEFIEDGRHEGCVLVHCNAGVSRAPTVVIAYLMRSRGMTLKESYDLVRSVRLGIRPNDGFMRTLREYEKEVRGGADI